MLMPLTRKRAFKAGWGKYYTAAVRATKRRLAASRNVRRRPGIGRSMVSGRDRPHSFHRWVTTYTYSSTSTGLSASEGTHFTFTGATGLKECDFGFAFCLDDLPNTTEFSNLYDQYRINFVKFTIKLVNCPQSSLPPQSTSSSTTNFFPTVWYATDHDDNNYATVAALKEYVAVKHKTLQPNKECSICVKPSILAQTYRTALTTGYAPQYKQWVDMANTNVPHYGIKFAIHFEGLTPPIGTVWEFQMNTKVYFQCKGVR